MKGKSIDKKKAATPVILIDESNDLTNTVIISKMMNGKENTSQIKPSSNVFSGGFKYRPQENSSKRMQQQNLNHLIASSKIDKMTVYDEFGLINQSIGKKKFRENVKQSTLHVNSPPSVFSNENPWKKERKEPVSNNFVDSSYYQISNLKDREQVAIHVKSSLEEINLENIQARIQAHRMSLKSVQQQYNLAKGKSLVQPQSEYKDKLRFNIDVERQYKDIQPQKVYQFIKQKQNQMDRPKQQLILQQMWEAKKKKDPKLAEYEFKYQQYLVEKEAKKMIGNVVKDKLFTWDKFATKEELDKRIIAKQRKSKEKYYAEVIQSKVLSKVYGNVENSTVEKPQQHFTNQSIDIEQKIASKDDKFISKFIMAEVDLDKRGTISKDELIDYLSSKQHLIKGYHIDLKWLHTDLDSFETKRKGMLNQQEVAYFLATLDKIHHPEIVLKEVKNKDKSKNSKIVQKEQNSQKVYSSYFKQHRRKFENIFKIIDINEDRIIKRQEFIENIYLDADCNIILDKTAIKLNIIDKNITFRQIISFILDDYRKEKNQKLKKSKEYITFQRFEQYFEIPQSLDLNSLDKNNNQKLKKENASRQIEMYDIEQQYLLILKDIFSTIPRVYQDYVVINDFISIALKDPQVLAVYEQLCRIQSVETNLPVQTIQSTLIRMTKECDQYATWEIIKTYFSRRGRPLDWDYDLIQKKKQIRQKKLKAGAQIAKQNLPIIQDGDQEQNNKKFVYSNANKKTINSISPQKYTIPKPFNITDQRKKKQVAKQISSQQKQIQQLKNKFKAKPVNKDILAPKPELIQGKVAKSDENVMYNYENYENDRIQRVLKKAQQEFQLAQTIKQIKQMSEIKAKDIKIDLNKKLNDVLEEQKRNKSKVKPKPTVPMSTNLYPQNPKDEGQRKIQKYKKQLEKQTLAEKMRQDLKKEVKYRAKEKNQIVKKTALQQKKKQKQQEKEISKLNQDSFKPKITKYQQSEEEKEAHRLQKEERQRKKQEQMQKIMEAQQSKRQKRLQFVKKQNKLEIAGLEDEQILSKIDQIDLENLLLSQEEKIQFRKEYKLKDKSRRQIKDRLSGLAGRQRATMQVQQKRLAEEKRKLKEQKQQKVVKEKIQSAKEMKQQITSTLNMDANFHRSKALRRYRALMEGKQPLPEYDAYSVVGEKQRSQI